MKLKTSLRSICLMAFIGGMTLSLSSQTVVQETYYKDVSKRIELPNKNKAKYLERISKIDEETKAFELYRIKDNQLIQYRCFRKDMPFGVWKFYNQSKKSFLELDYSFEVLYDSQKIEGAIYFSFTTGDIESTIQSDDKIIAPKLKGFSSPPICLFKTIKYPRHARENGISGEVKLHIKVDKSGRLSILSVYEGIEPHLDVESIRAIKGCAEWEPATLNGVEIDSYSIVSVKYKLE